MRAIAIRLEDMIRMTTVAFLSQSADHKSPFVISGAIAAMLPSTIKTEPIEIVKTTASEHGSQAAGEVLHRS